MAGAPLGNKNAVTGCMFKDALSHEIAAMGRKLREQSKETGESDNGDVAIVVGMRFLAKKHLKSALEDKPLSTALKEIADRFDGRPTTSIEVAGPDGGPIQATEWTVLPVTPINMAGGPVAQEPVEPVPESANPDS